MTWDIEKNMQDLPGKVAIVTGGNTGIGKETVRQLARRGAVVYMASRTEARARAAIEELTNAHPEIATKGGRIEFLQLDLTNLAGCQAAARAFLEKEKRLDILINNAGIMATPAELTADGFDIQFQSNHLGHFAFTYPLLPILIETSKDPSTSVRIVQVTSRGHTLASSDVRFDSIDSVNRDFGSPWRRYGQSKLANILFAKMLARRLAPHRIFSSATHPGVVRTELTRGTMQSYPWLRPVQGVLECILGALVLVSPYNGALTPLYAAVAPEIEENGWRGEYFVPYAKRTQPSKQAMDDKLAEELWTFSENMVREKCGSLE